MEFNIKSWQIVVGLLVALVVFAIASTISINNTAIGYDETIQNAKSGIDVQSKREYDLVTKLVQVVEANSQYEKETLLAVTQARASLKTGNVSSAALAINAVAEQYPELKANSSYTQLMTELATSENLKTQYRNTYNDSVQNYDQFVRRFPNGAVLRWVGYEAVKYGYLTFEDTNLPDQLFKP